MNDDTKTEAITRLTNQTPIARGAVRDVWDRPGHPNQLLKTIRAYKREKYMGRTGLRRALDDVRLGPYGTFRIEYKCYIHTAYQCAKAGRRIPIAEIGGLVITDHGLAQVTEKITDGSGALAQTFSAVLKSGGMTQAHLQMLNDLTHTVLALNVNVPDLKAANIVFDAPGQRFVLIDGYGDKTVVPIRAWVPPLNQKQLVKRFAQLAVPGVLQWDAQRKQFSLV